MYVYMASQVALVVKNLPVNAGDIRDEVLNPRWGRSPGGGRGNLGQYGEYWSAWRIPWTKIAWQAVESLGLQRFGHDWSYIYIYKCIYKRQREWNRHRERGSSDFTRVKCKFSFLVGANGKESACQCRRCKRHEFDLWVEKVPWRRKWQPSSVFLPGKFHGQRSLAGYIESQRVGCDWACKG